MKNAKQQETPKGLSGDIGMRFAPTIALLFATSCATDVIEHDAGTADTGPPADATVVDAGPSDLGVLDVGVIDSSVDAGPTDTGTIDTGTIDTGIVDTGTIDTGIVDTGIVDTGSTDTGIADAGTMDASPSDAGNVPLILNGMQLEVGIAPYRLDDSFVGSRPYYGFSFPPRYDHSASIPLPFPFTFMGTTYATGTPLTVTSNGSLFFGTGAINHDNQLLPIVGGAPGRIAAFWDWLLWGTDVVIRTTPTQIRILFYAVTNPGISAALTVQMTLNRTTNIIEFAYHEVSNTSATIGFENGSGTDAVQLPCSPTCSGADIPPGTLVRIAPIGTIIGYDVEPVALLPASLPPTIYTGDLIPLTAIQFRNNGLLPSTNGLFSLNLGWPTLDLNTQFGDLRDPLPTNIPPGGTATYTIPSHVELRARTPGLIPVWVVLEPDEGDVQHLNDAVHLGDIQVLPRLGNCSITTAMLPIGTIGQPYAAQLTTTTCANPVWTLVTGSLPSGLSLDPSGAITGTPTQAFAGALVLRVEATGYAPDTISLPLIVQ